MFKLKQTNYQYSTLNNSTNKNDIESAKEEKQSDKTTTNQENEVDSDKEKKEKDLDNIKMPPGLSMAGKIKFLIVNYGALAIVVHFSIYAITIASFYLALSSGVDVKKIYNFLHLPQSPKLEGLGVFAVAFALTKLTGLIRIPITVVVVPFLARFLRRIRRK
eukprot:gene9647-11829_t